MPLHLHFLQVVYHVHADVLAAHGQPAHVHCRKGLVVTSTRRKPLNELTLLLVTSLCVRFGLLLFMVFVARLSHRTGLLGSFVTVQIRHMLESRVPAVAWESERNE